MSISNADHLCINCLREKADDGVCPYCGFDESTYEPSPHHLQPRSILGGKCLIGRVLGEGGFGITYIGLDLNLDLKLAIKEYYPTGFVTRTNTTTNTVTPYRGEKAEFFIAGRSRFINEAKTLAKFYALPGIVSVRDFFLENGTAYIVMEFVEGETLKQQLARVGGKMPLVEVFDLVRPLLRSLAEMHAAGLIHRDISPDNIMITPEGNVKLIDFGSARDYLDSGNRSLSVMLKPGYAPQEQYFARGLQGPWTDIYALSATIYRAITGITPPESVERLRRDELKVPSAIGIAISPALEAALLKGLAVSHEDRWQSIPELNQALYPDHQHPLPQTAFSNVNKAGANSSVAISHSDLVENHPSSKQDSSNHPDHENNDSPDSMNVPSQKAKKRKIIVASLAISCVVTCLIALTIHGFIIKKNSHQIELLMQAENYEAAMILIRRIEQPEKGYDETLYQAAQDFLDADEYDKAVIAREKMTDVNWTDTSLLDDKFKYAEVAQYFKNDTIDQAIRGIKSLQATDPEIAANLTDAYTEEIYAFGVSQYREWSFYNSESAFELLPSNFQRTKDYLLLIQVNSSIKAGTFSWLWDTDYVDADRILATQLIELVGFENATALILKQEKSTILFLDGSWTDGTLYYKFYPSPDDQSKYRVSANIPGCIDKCVFWSFVNNDFCLNQENGDCDKTARFTILDHDTIEVYVYSTDKTYTLCRE